TVGTSSRSFVTQPGKAWVTGAFVYVVDAADASNLMYGQITSYDAGSGEVVVEVSYAIGDGTHSSWVVGLSVPSSGEIQCATLDVVSPGKGSVALRAGSDGNSGFVAFYTPDGTYAGYVGYAEA